MQVVSSRHWPLISRYRASVRTQSPKVEMIDNLFKKVSETEDDGIMKWVSSFWFTFYFYFLIQCECTLKVVFWLTSTCRELLLDFYVSSAKRKPDQIIIFR